MAAPNTKEALIEFAKGQDALILRVERARQSDFGERNKLGGLLHFVRALWHVLEPNKALVEGKVLDAIILHLEAVTRGEIRRLLINVSPGSMKSLLVNVFWPLWEWSACGMAYKRFLAFSYAAHLTERDNGRMRDVIRSQRFQELWGSAFDLTEDGKVKLANSETGWKFASSWKGVGTGERGDVIIYDDPHNIKEGESEAVRTETTRWVREGMSNRLNSMETGAIVIIMQRVHEDDVTGVILSENDSLGYDHLSIPMEFDPLRDKVPTSIGWVDWRTQDGELCWPERFSQQTVNELKRALGPYAFAGQYQQSPEPRGGGIFKRDWWQPYALHPHTENGRPHPRAGHPILPPHFVVASLDPAFSNKEENDPSGFTIWGIFRDPVRTGGVTGRSVKSIFPDREMQRLGIVSDQTTFENTAPVYLAKAALIYAWQKRLEMHGEGVTRQKGESDASFVARSKLKWGLVEWVAYDCKRMQVDLLLVENKASGLDVYHELKRLYRGHRFGVQVVDPGALDKRSRAFSIQHMFADGLVCAPDRDWAAMVIDEFAKFRGLAGDRDNLVDAGTQALRWMRDSGILLRHEEHLEDEQEKARYRRPLEPLYPDV